MLLYYRGGILALAGIAGFDIVDDMNVFAEYELPPAALETRLLLFNEGLVSLNSPAENNPGKGLAW